MAKIDVVRRIYSNIINGLWNKNYRKHAIMIKNVENTSLWEPIHSVEKLIVLLFWISLQFLYKDIWISLII